MDKKKIQLYYLPIQNDRCDGNFNDLMQFISPAKKERIRKFRFSIDQKLSLYAELLVRIIACQSLQIENDNLEFSINEFGKPYLKDKPFNFYFNLSHTKSAVVAAVSNQEIGVDIERKAETNLGIAFRFFTKSEYNYIDEFPDKREERFYEVWTKKEAYIKFVGKGLAIPLNSFNVFDHKIASRIKTLHQDNYIISVCSDIVEADVVFVKVNEDWVAWQSNKILKKKFHA